MITFDDKSIITSYIKEFLYDFNLPNCDVWKANTRVYKDCFYIYNNCLLQAKNTGTFDSITTANFKVIIDGYVFGDKILNITKNLVLNNLNYDTYTHEYLGNYLRFLRDYKKLDLMSLYNCFSNKQLNYVNIDYRYNGENYSFNNNDGSKVYSIPIRPYNTYTIFLDCMAPVDMIACYYASNDVQDYKFGETKSNTYPYFLTRMTKANLSFNNPFIYDKLSEESLNGDNHNIDWDLVKDKFMYEHRGQLRLLIKIPAENNSSIVVLEGDYTQNSDVHFSNNTLCLTENIYGIPLDKETGETLSHYDAIDVVSNYYSLSSYNVSKLNDGDIIKVLTDETRDSTTTYYEYKLLFKGYEFRYLRTQEFNSKIGLAKIQSGVNHPFSDRLLEYLFNSVISSDDSINKNIARVQKALKGGVRVSKATVYGRDLGLSGVWSNPIRNSIYSVAKTSKLINSKYDLLGYYDKDVETIINLGDDF